jgi:hypothetical protein
VKSQINKDGSSYNHEGTSSLNQGLNEAQHWEKRALHYNTFSNTKLLSNSKSTWFLITICEATYG